MSTCLAIYLLLLVLSLASSQYLTPQYIQQDAATQETRRSGPGDPYSRISYKFTPVGPNGANYGPPVIKKFEIRPDPSFYAQAAQAQNQQQSAPAMPAYQPNNFQEYQPRMTQPLFTPSAQPYPAHTAGQVKSMQDYMQEERRDVEKERREAEMKRAQAQGQAQSHVSYAAPNQAYSYQIKY